MSPRLVFIFELHCGGMSLSAADRSAPVTLGNLENGPNTAGK